MVEFRFYNHHGANAHLVDVAYWEEDVDDGCEVEIAGHVMFFRQPEVRGSHCQPAEVKLLLFLTFRSEEEAKAVANIASAARQDMGFLAQVQQRLSHLCSRPSIFQGGQAQPQCFVRDDRDVIYKANYEQEAKMLKCKRWIRRGDRRQVHLALEKCRNQRICTPAGAGNGTAEFGRVCLT